MKETFARRIKELAALDGVSGFEHRVVSYMATAFEAMGLPVRVDQFGNLIVKKEGTAEGPTVMVAAHSDEIGAMVRTIDSHGFLRFEKIGGTQDLLLPGRMVSVGGVFGVIGVKAGHLQKGSTGVPSHVDMYIDVGASSAEEVKSLGIQVGDPISYVSEVRNFSNPDLLCGKAVDNRVGCAMMLQLFEDLDSRQLPGTIYGVINSQEEVGWRGIQFVARQINPDSAIVVDTVPSGDTPDTDLQRELGIRIGAGPVIAVLSGDSRNGYIMHPGIKELLIRLATEQEIPYQVALFPGSGSDAITLHMVGEGIPTGIVNIPRRYAHSPVEMLDLNDVVNAQKLLTRATEALATESVSWGW